MKKSLSLLLAFALVFSMFSSLALANDNLTTLEKYEALKAKGIFAGMPDGSAGLDQNMTRAQFARVSALILGLEPDSKVVTEKPFKDVELDAWYVEEVAAAKEAGIMVGNPDGTFNPNGDITVQELAVVTAQLVGLEPVQGAEIDGAADWAARYIQALLDNGFNFPTNYKDNATRADLVEAAYSAADEIGLLADPAEVSAAQTGGKKITVTFNAAADDSKVKISVFNGNTPVNPKEIKFADNKRSADIEFSHFLTETEYTVKVENFGSEAIELKVQAEESTVESIEFNSDKLVLDRVDDTIARVSYTVKNQFDEDVTSAESVRVTTSKGNAPTHATGTIEITNAVSFQLDETVQVTALHEGTATFAAATVKVSLPSRVHTVDLVELQAKDDKTIQVGADPADFKILVALKDQYGNDIKEVTYWGDDVVLTNPGNIIDVGAPIVDDEKIYLPVTDIKAEGETTLTLVATGSGNNDKLTIKVIDAVKLDTLTLQAPTLAAKGDPDVEIPFTAIDQFGNEIKHPEGAQRIALTANGAGVNGANVPLTWHKDVVNDKTVLKFNLDDTAASTIQITGVTQTGKFVNLTFSTRDKAKATSISEVKDINALLVGDHKDVNAGDNVVIKDQYGRDMDLPAGWSIKSEISGDAVTQSAGTFPLTYTAAKKGSSTITLTLNDGTKDVANSSYTFSLRVVEMGDFESYDASIDGKIYDDTNDPAVSAAYAKKLNVYGILADGTKVYIPGNSGHFAVRSNVPGVTYNDGYQLMVKSHGFDFGDKSEGEAPIVVLVTGGKTSEVITVTASLSNNEPVVDKLELKDGAIGKKESDDLVSVANAAAVNSDAKIAALVDDVVKVIDQYGFDDKVTATYSATIASNFDGATGLTDPELGQGDTFTVTAVTDNNKIIQFKVIIRD